MLLVTTALTGLMAGVIQTAPAPQQQQQPAAQPPVDRVEDVLVQGQRSRGAVNTDIPADVVLTAEQLQAYGASDIEELLTYLEPITRSSSGRSDLPPVMLVNGRRISGFQEIQGIPPEAIERIETYPEEVALQFGYRPEQRVVNFVLKAEFRSLTAEVQGRVSAQGGRSVGEIEGNVLRISRGDRWSLDVEHENSTPLFESERDIVRDPGSTPYDLIGNVTSNPYRPGCPTDPSVPNRCPPIDPALGAAIITPVPGATATPSLADFIAAAGDPRTGDLGAYRTLMAESERSTLRGTIKRDLNGTTQVTFSGSLEDSSSRSFNGLPGISLNLDGANPFSPFADDVLVHRYIDDAQSLRRQTDTLTAKIGALADGYLGEDWRWTLSGNYERVETDTVTGRGYAATPFQARLDAGDASANPFAALNPTDFARIANDTANSVSQLLAAELVLNGDVYELPGGGVSSTFKFGADTRSLDSTSVRSGVASDRSQSRDRFSGQASFNIPIASRRQAVLPMLGDLSLNLNAGYEELSDFGGLPSVGLGVNWSPVEPFNLSVNFSEEQGAPTIGQLNDPTLSTLNVPVFDFATGQTVLITRVDGGNPDLDADTRTVWRVGATLRPFKETDFQLSTTWTASRIDDYLSAFPTLTPDLEAALPGRFTRTNGVLTAIDARPLNFERYERQDLRTGFNYSRAFGKPNPAAAALPGQPGSARPPVPGMGMGRPMMVTMQGPGGGPGGGGGAGPGGGAGTTVVRMGGGGRGGPPMLPGQGRFNVSIYHTYRFQDELTIADGLPVIDLLDGGATGARGGSPRQEVQFQAGVFRNGMGAFMMGQWRESTRVDGGTGPDLRFSDQTTVSLNVFMDLGSRTSWVAKHPWLKGARLHFGVQNLFDTRPEVSVSSGEVPLTYQPDYLDPMGRTISLNFRKILF